MAYGPRYSHPRLGSIAGRILWTELYRCSAHTCLPVFQRSQVCRCARRSNEPLHWLGCTKAKSHRMLCRRCECFKRLDMAGWGPTRLPTRLGWDPVWQVGAQPGCQPGMAGWGPTTLPAQL
ncbi:unnamed protein product [Chondrus crispus]|uniref:Uncharacterized protein n=1 Tax=Chondrus crispus TaxID=2769 RepID=R7QAM4_CHOCR|nr:unnamed protein product [Chondrus crispus]CDF35114.1 unnamed protein product [Chondrus crispus]|eukprot:XP_005714933.1 unnamed protein product [Chondrus crispus]